MTRAHNDLNVLTLGARSTDPADAERMIDAFLQAEFEGGRHTRRVAQIAALEQPGNGESK
jgi:RpiB/LacA/LacB family sugar-phosphate isomerase